MTVNKKVLKQRSLLMAILILAFVSVIAFVSLTLIILHHHYTDDDEENKPLNVLFIVVDDLRPTLGCYGDERAITPNIDQLAAKSIVFTNAFAQQALGAPSRISFLTSRRPDSLHLYDNGNSYWRKDIFNFTTLPEHFKNNGYETVSIGKVFHHGAVSNHTDDYPYSWTTKPYKLPTQVSKMADVCMSPDGKKYMNLICPVDVDKQPDESLPDLQVAEYAAQYLMKKSSGPEKGKKFFLGVGFYKPHMPFKIPREYFDLYPLESMGLAKNNSKPTLMPEVSWNPWADIREWDDVKSLNVSFPYGPLPEDFQKKIRQGYYAAVSYVDDQIGKLLEALEKSEYASNTAVLLIGDHGWSLGEHGEWSKYSNFDIALKVPFILFVPGLTEKHASRVPFEHKPVNITKKASPGSGIKDHTEVTELNQNDTNLLSPVKGKYVSPFFVELVDIFPTLAEVANISIPTLCPMHNLTEFCSEGVSLHPIIVEYVYPFKEFTWKTAVFSQHPRPSNTPQNNSDQPKLEDIKIMGYTIRDEYFKYIRWVLFNSTNVVPYSDQTEWCDCNEEMCNCKEELYDITSDPDELTNLANRPDYYNTRKHLFTRLKKGWRRELPLAIFGTYYSNRKMLLRKR